MLVAHLDGRAIGFTSLLQRFPETVEMCCMGVLPDYHRQGAGQLLVEVAAGAARASGARLLMVRKLGLSHSDPFYDATRAFYLAQGFLPLAELPEIWGPDDPCLILVRPL